MANESGLIYVTGLSIDKASMNQIYRDVATDCRYQAFHKLVAERKKLLSQHGQAKKMLMAISSVFDKIYQLSEKKAGPIILTKLLLQMDDSGTLQQLYDGYFPGSIDAVLMKYHNAILEKAKKKAGANEDDLLFQAALVSLILKTLKKNPQQESCEPSGLDYFNLFTTHQSDSRGILPMVSIMEQFSEKGGASWVYSDFPYYMNKFVRGVSISINKSSRLSSNWEDIVEAVADSFFHHYILINIQKNIDKSIYPDHIETNYLRNKFDFLSKLSQHMNYFGISLLSDVLYKLKTINGSALSIRIAEKERIYDKPGKRHNNNLDFVSETVLLAGSPAETKIVDSDEYDVAIKYCDADEFAKSGTESFFNDKECLIHIPINMVVSVPLEKETDDEKKPYFRCNYHLLFPSEAYGAKPAEKSIIDVLTIGGVEHNRPLLRLLNAARYQGYLIEQSPVFKGELSIYSRIIGFTDNRFDFDWYLDPQKRNSIRVRTLLNINNFVGISSNQIIENYRNCSELTDTEVESLSVIEQRNREYALVLSSKIFLKELKFDWNESEPATPESAVYTLNIRSLIGLSARASSFAMLKEALDLIDNESAMNNPARELFRYNTSGGQIKSWDSSTEEKLYMITGGINPYLYIMNSRSWKDENNKFDRLRVKLNGQS